MKCRVHQYYRKNLATTPGKEYIVYQCNNCTHYIPVSLVPNKESLCWRCGEIFRIPKVQVSKKIVKPYCSAHKHVVDDDMVDFAAKLIGG